MNAKKGAVAAILIGFAAFAVFGDTIVVDVHGGAGHDFTQLQRAISKAKSGDTILVRPGEYRATLTPAADGANDFMTYEGGDDGDNLPKGVFTNYLHITKKLYIKSTDGASKTFICGAHDASTPEGTLGAKAGVGPAAIRAVYIGPGGDGTVIEGFTIRDGAAHRAYKANGSTACADGIANRAGGIENESGGGKAYAVDCVITGCTGGRNGALYAMSAIRCRITDNRAVHGGSVGRYCNMLNCLIDNNSASGGAVMGCQMINCTFAGNGAGSSGSCPMTSSSQSLYNTLCADNANERTFGNEVTSDPIKVYSCVFNDTVAENQQDAVRTMDADTIKDAAVYQVMSTAVGDYRLRRSATGVCEGRGKADYIANFNVSYAIPDAEIDLYRDFAGRPIPKTGAIDVGCYQGAVTPGGGGIVFSRGAAIDGYAVQGESATFLFSEEPQHLVKIAPFRGGHVSYWSVGGKYMAPELDGKDSLWVVTPPAGVTYSVTCSYGGLYYADASSKSEVEDGSAAHPWKTLQAAFKPAAEGGMAENGILFVAAGTYDQGGKADSVNGNSRLYVDRQCRIVGAGRETTFIEGALDTGSGDSHKRGANAYRCVTIDTSAVVLIQGFTFRKGRSIGTDTAAAARNYGGLIYGVTGSATDQHVIADSTLTDGVAFRSSIARCVKMVRCELDGVKSIGGGLCRPATLDTVIVRNVAEGSSSLFDGEGGDTVHSSTIHCLQAPSMWSTTSTGVKCINSIFYGPSASFAYADDATKQNARGCVIKSATAMTAAGKTFNADADAHFVGADDLRLCADTPALNAGIEDQTGTYAYYTLSQTDIYGNPRIYRNGKTLPGAVQRVVEGVNVVASAVPGDTTVDVAEGWHSLEPGESLTLTATLASDKRCLTGLWVGEAFLTNELGAATMTYTYTAPGTGRFTEGGLTISPAVNADWYVSPTGDDEADGWTVETPRKTLAGAMKVVRAGDTVHAAAGTYSEGSMEPTFVNTEPSTIHSRVIVPAGVTLVGDEGAEKTVIAGSSPDSGDHWSADAVRCASVEITGTLKGFTLFGGRTAYKNKNNVQVDGGQDDGTGGGVLVQTTGGREGKYGYVRDCVITNCMAMRGGGSAGTYAKYINCAYRCNSSYRSSSASYYGEFFGCLFDGNVNGGGHIIRFCAGVHNCTVTANNGKISDVASSMPAGSDGSFDNSVVLVTAELVKSINVSHSVCASFTNKEIVDLGGNTLGVTSLADAGLDADLRPVKGGLTMDKGDNARVPAWIEHDFAGGQRVYNGNVDLGCYEYDWRGDYAADLGSCASVEAAAPQVVETSGGKVLVKGGTLALAFDDTTGKAKYKVPFEVTGTGTLTLLAGDEVVGAFTAADGAQNLVFRDKTWGRKLSFAYAPGANDDGGALLDAISGGVPGFALFIR